MNANGNVSTRQNKNASSSSFTFKSDFTKKSFVIYFLIASRPRLSAFVSCRQSQSERE
jgi:hypothetical protein